MATTTRQIIIWGAGGHGRVVADAARAMGYELAGFVDRDRSRLGDRVGQSGASILAADDDFLWELETSGRWFGTAVALGIGDNAARVRCLARLPLAATPPIIHPSASVSGSATIGRGTVVFPNATVNADATIGDAVIVNSGAVIEHDCVLETGVHVSPGAILTGSVRIAASAWIGAGASIVPGVRIGARSIIGAGAVVLSDVPADATYAGVPARRLR